MGKSQREYMKRHAERAMNGLDKTIDQLGLLRKMYHEGGIEYIEYEQYLEVISQMVQVAHEQLLVFTSKYI